MKKIDELNIAIIYDRVNKIGGAEKVLMALHEMFPKAPLYTSVYSHKHVPWAKVFPKIYTSFIQKIPYANTLHELFGWLMPIAFEQFDFSYYDLVISVTSEAAKGIITKEKTLHVCYVLTPTRYLWSHFDLYFKNPLLRFVSAPVVKYLKIWEKMSSRRPDFLISISTAVKNRIKHFYDLNSEIIFPPVDIDAARINIHKRKKAAHKYFLYVGRLVPYKRVDLLVETFNETGDKLLVIGSGSEESRLRGLASENIKFVGQIRDDNLALYYSNAIGFLMPQEEDFGIASVEAQSYGVPVIAYNKGGSLDTVINGKTGIYFREQNKASLKSAIANFKKIRFNHNYIINHAQRFSKARFKRELQRSLVRAYSSWWRRNKTLAQIKK